MITTNDIIECAQTVEQSKAELDEIEDKLALRYEIKRDVRRRLIEMARAGELDEDEDDLVSDWHDAYSAYLDFVRDQRSVDPPPKTSPPNAGMGTRDEAAQAASSVSAIH